MQVTRLATLERLVTRLPQWAVAAVAIACLTAGAVLTLRPFESVEVLAVLVGINAILTAAIVVAAPDERSSPYRWVLAIGWFVLGIAVLAWPGLSVRTLAVVVGIALIVHGAVDILQSLTGRHAEWVAELIGGAAAIVFGVLALAWPDLTVLVVAVLFGARTVLFGLSTLIDVAKRWWRPAGKQGTDRALNGRLRYWLRIANHAVALIVAVGLLAVSVALHRGETDVPAFYDWDDDIPTTPGQLLRSEPLGDSVPDIANGWLILYSTQTSKGEPAVGSAYILASKNLPSGPRPVILWDHGTVGIARPCAPSLFDDVTRGLPAVPETLEQGWVIVAADYVGMGTEGPSPYLVGTGQAYSALDAAKAAHQLTDLSLSNQTVVWGHSQGGHAALWTGTLAPSYAPELQIDGVAALSPATDIVALAQSVQHRALGTVVSAFVLTAYSDAYDDVRLDDYVRPGASVQVREASERCLADPSLAASVISGLGGQSVSTQDPSAGPLGERLRENIPTADVGGVPLLVAQGTGDEVINISITEEWVPAQCAAGYHLDFRTYPDFTHMGVIQPPSPLPAELIAWTADRFAGNPATPTC